MSIDKRIHRKASDYVAALQNPDAAELEPRKNPPPPESETAKGRGRCLKCAKPLADHRRFTQADIDASQGATYHKPINGYLAPLSPTLIGQWMHHDPMPWTEAIQAGYQIPT